MDTTYHIKGQKPKSKTVKVKAVIIDRTSAMLALCTYTATTVMSQLQLGSPCSTAGVNTLEMRQSQEHQDKVAAAHPCLSLSCKMNGMFPNSA